MPEFLSLLTPWPELPEDPESAGGLSEAADVGPAFGYPLEVAPPFGSEYEGPDADPDPLEEIVFGEHLFL